MNGGIHHPIGTGISASVLDIAWQEVVAFLSTKGSDSQEGEMSVLNRMAMVCQVASWKFRSTCLLE